MEAIITSIHRDESSDTNVEVDLYSFSQDKSIRMIYYINDVIIDDILNHAKKLLTEDNYCDKEVLRYLNSLSDNVEVLDLGNNIANDNMITEKVLSAEERTDFGLPDQKKYPMPDIQHVYSAISYFSKCEPKYREELAKNINKYIKKYNMKDLHVSKDSAFYKYFKPLDETTQVGGVSYMNPGGLTNNPKEVIPPDGTDEVSKLSESTNTPKKYHFYDVFDLSTTGISSYDSYLKSDTLEYRQLAKGDTGIIELMSPKEYLHRVAIDVMNQTPEEMDANLDYDHAQEYSQSMKSGDKFPLLILDLRDTKAQEGRHRAIAADLIGVELIPVLVVTNYSLSDDLGIDKSSTYDYTKGIITIWNEDTKEFVDYKVGTTKSQIKDYIYSHNLMNKN